MTPSPADAQMEQVLAYAEATHALVLEQRRRLATAALAVALCFLAVAAAAAYGWSDAREQAAQVQDAAIAEAFGVRIPDPRPALQRLELRTRALVFGVVALTCGATGLLALAVWALVRPAAAPHPGLSSSPVAATAKVNKPRAQPPM